MLKPPVTPLDQLIAELAAMLGPAEEASIGSNNAPEFPCVFNVGNSRCGSTLMLQWMASTGAFCYPSNLLARFYASPYIGGRIQQLLTDPCYQHFDEFRELATDGGFTSSTGKTNGLLAPHVFWHFWRRFVPTYFLEPIAPDQEHLVDGQGIRNGLAAIQRVFGKPLALKAKMFNFNIGKLHEVCPRAVFLHLKRDPAMVAQSIYLVRTSIQANRDWYGVRPPEYAELLKSDIYTQIAGQIRFTDQHLDEQLAGLPEECVLRTTYESFCSDPSAVYGGLATRLAKLGYDLPADYAGPKSFAPSRTLRIAQPEFEKLSSALQQLSGSVPA
jgi:LPS sulfotransferase NodH